MDSTAVTSAVLMLLSGIGIFLVACTMMSHNLESISSTRLKAMFSQASKSKLLGVIIGAIGTALIQSSGATTVMVIGFVNAGIMSLVQAATFVYGANIGTTITGQIVALGLSGGSGGVSTTVMFSAMAGIGAFMSAFAKKETTKQIGNIIAGFGMLFVGLHIMSSSMECFARLEEVKSFLASISNVIALVIIGAIMTAIIQSSSVMTSVAITMVVAGLITLEQGIYLTMGSNIGSCVVAIIAGITSGTNAKRTAMLHFIFNVCGVVAFVLIGYALTISTGGSTTFGTIFADLFPKAPQLQLAMFHTVFNVLTVIFVYPMTDALVNFVVKIIPDKPVEKEKKNENTHLFFIDDYILTMPSIAVQQAKNEIVNMGAIAMRNFALACHIICTLDYEEIERFRANEEELDFLNREIVSFLVKLSGEQLSSRDHAFIATAFHSVTDLERVGDYAENIIEYADNLKEMGETFSAPAISEINDTLQLIRNLYSKAMEAYIHESKAALDDAYAFEEQVDIITREMAEKHIERLNKGECTPDVGTQYMSIASDAERVADHFINVAKAIRQLK